MALMDLEREVAELKRRVDLHDTMLAQQSGQFEFISTQLREVQRFMHAKFAEHDRRFDDIDRRFDGIDRRFDQIDRRFEQIDRQFEQIDRRFEQVEGKLDALPRIIAEMITNR